MKNIFAVVALIATFFVATLGHAAEAQPKPEKLTKQQLSSLITNAKTPAEHQRIANYYSTMAQDDLAQSKMHQEMANQFAANSATSSSKNATGTVNHCQFLANSLKEKSKQSQVLADEHAKMAVESQK